MTNNNYGELFCQAVDTIVKERLAAISYDLTTLCTIVNDSRREEGIYTVSNGSVKFDAYSDNTSYREGNNVYVTIPEGDWNLTKFITGKKAAKDAEIAYNYRQPFDSLVDVTGNIISVRIPSSETGLVANDIANQDDGYRAVTLWSYNVNDSSALYKEKGKEEFKGYTRLGIQAGFQSWLNPYYEVAYNEVTKEKYTKTTHVIEGSYGLRLRIHVLNDNVKDTQTAGYYDLYLDAADMNGNPYDFETFFLQEKVFDISNFDKIDSMELQFYEKPKSFKDEEGTEILHTDFLGNTIAPNLFCNDIYICFGYDISTFGDNEVVLYSLNSSTYGSAANDEKVVKLRWIHNFGDNNYKVVDENNIKDLDCEIIWYRYRLGAQSADIYSGVYWERVINDEVFLYKFTPNRALEKEQIKVIILYNGIPLRSNILVFENENEVINLPTLDAILAVNINCEDNSYGNYRIYALGNSLIDSADGPKVREWKVYFNESELTEAESIEWIIPYENTMIVIDGHESDKNSLDGSYHIIVKGDVNDAYTIVSTLNYRIRSYYSLNYNRNTIECIVTKNGILYYGTKEMTFGVQGTTGTDCTFVLDFDNGITALTYNQEAVTVTARLYDYENKEVTGLDKMNIVWSWKSGSYNYMSHRPSTTNRNNLREIIVNTSSVPNDNYYILLATLTGWGDYPLVAYLPIPIRSSTLYLFISGPTSIIYNSLGLVGDYFSNPYAIYTTSDGLLTANGNIIWSIIRLDSFSPEVKLNGNKGYCLYPKSIYIEESNLNLCVCCTINGNRVWSLPLLIMQNKYPSKMLNDWNGELSIDDKNNSILATRIAAGKKDSNNTFTGVVMGDWSQNTTDIGTTGLYGFRRGDATFGFKEDGTAFIGGSSTGRIEFDGTRGVISSAVYNAGSGMEIDLKEGRINAHLFELNAGKNETTPSGEGKDSTIYISTRALTYPLRIGSNFKVDWNGNIYATDAYFEDGYFGGEINATSGTLGNLNISGTLSGGTLSGSTIEGGEIIGNTGIYIPSVKDWKFKVESNGIMHAEGANVTGIINATELNCDYGNIGGWEIAEFTLASSQSTYGISDTILNSKNGSITTKTFIIGSGGTSYGSMGILTGLTGYGKTTYNLGIKTVDSDKSVILESENANIRLSAGMYNSSLNEWLPSFNRNCNVYVGGYEVQIASGNKVVFKGGDVYFDEVNVHGLPDSGGGGGYARFG